MEVLWNIPNNASDNLFTSSEEKVKHVDRDVEDHPTRVTKIKLT